MNPVVIGNATLYLGNCVDLMASLPENSLDSIICDPPYLLSFMGKAFDSQHKSLPGANEGQKMQEWHRRWVKEAYRILKPGGHLAAFGGDRTHHRLMSAMEDVGFELRFGLYWCFGSGFPKSKSASMAIDEHFGLKEQRKVVATWNIPGRSSRSEEQRYGLTNDSGNITEPAHPLAKQWSGYGTATKPAVEICAVGRKPMIGTLAENLLEWGCGAMNLDACRVGENAGWNYPNGRGGKGWQGMESLSKNLVEPISSTLGRFPPHLLHDGSEVVKKCFPETSSGGGKRRPKAWTTSVYGMSQDASDYERDSDSGSAARFFPSLPYDEEDCATLFYCVKASRTDRNQGCEGMDAKRTTFAEGTGLRNNGDGTPRNQLPSNYNHHVSVKPTSLMRWICRLLTPKGGTLLDPFMGSGSTLKAAVLEGFTCIGMEMDADYFDIACARVAHVSPEAVMVNPTPRTMANQPAQGSLL